ncbi:cytochrome P450 2J6-like [Varanus komodoensis]|uniref:cytochrome P450 2J6-like n=1 Tax=Varanus komodoensis TaxID=61221 RepID=UPI001CF79A76|nr:cytochrome P450 2J6-like [Varanus komodoensis]
MELSACFAIAVLSLLFLQFLKLQWVKWHLPPGPVPLPVLGTVWCFASGWHQNTLSKLSKIYGEIFTIWIGHLPMVVVNGFHPVKHVLVNHAEEVSWRVVSPFVRDMMHEKGILFSGGHIWKEQRKFGVATLRLLGFGRSNMEHRVQEEASNLVALLASEKGKPLDPALPLFHAVSNVISSVVFGHRFSIQDETFCKLVECIEYEAHFFLSKCHFLYELFPWLMRRLPGPHQKAISCLEFIHSFGRKEIRNHKEKKKLDDLPDFIDYYLSEIDRKKGDPATSLDEDNLVQVIYDLFTAGTDTVVSTLQWALLFMVVYPDVQENIQKEIDAVLTPSQCIFYEDQKKMPYTNAVIHEILRFNFVLLVGSFRRCTKDTTILGFPIKKGTIVILDIASALYDPKKWETPHQFNPNHFLDKDGNFQNNDAFIPFSVGQRLCLGENLARKELFLFITNVLQAFTLQMPEGVTELSTTPAKGFSVQPYPYKICALPRNLVA